MKTSSTGRTEAKGSPSTTNQTPQSNILYEESAPEAHGPAGGHVPEAGRPVAGLRRVHVREAINFSSINEVVRHRHLLTPDERDLLADVQWKINRFPKKFKRPEQDYASLAAIIMMSNWPYRERFLRCGIAGRCCGWSRVCPACAFVRRRGIYERILRSRATEPWYFTTITYTSDLCFHPGFDDNMLPYWNAPLAALREATREGVFSGVLAQEALHIEAMVPHVRVLPHVHALGCSPNLRASHLEQLRSRVTAYRPLIPEEPWSNPEVELIEREVSSRTYRLASKTDLARVLRYLCKPMDLVTPYFAGWTTLVRDHPDRAVQLNQNVQELVHGIALNIAGRPHHRRWGSLWPTHRASVIVPQAKRNRRDYWDGIREELREMDDADRVARLLSSEEVVRPWMGLSLEEMDARVALPRASQRFSLDGVRELLAASSRRFLERFGL